MNKYWKQVIVPKTYRPPGMKEEVVVDRKRIEHWYAQAKKMFARGHKVPIPYTHIEAAVPVTKATKLSISPKDLAGYAIDAAIQTDGSLHYLCEPATEDDDANFGTRIRDMSIRTKDWQDGDGEKYDDSIVHIAACTYPAAHGTSEFVPSEGLALSLSMAADGVYPGSSEASTDNSLESAVALMAEMGIELGDFITTPEEFITTLCIAVRAVNSATKQEEGEDDLTQRPGEAVTKRPTPIAMSIDEIQFALDVVSESPNNPATGKPWTSAEIEAKHKAFKEAQPTLKFSAEDQAAYDLTQLNNKKIIAGRLSNCVKGMTMPQPFAEKILKKVEAVELKFTADGSVDEDAHGDIFMPLQMAEASTPGAALNGMSPSDVKKTRDELKLDLGTENHPENFHGSSGEITPEQALKNADRMLASVL